MLIWLGKQYLGQSDKAEISGEVKARVIRTPLAGPPVTAKPKAKKKKEAGI